MYLEENRNREESIRTQVAQVMGNAKYDVNVLACGNVVEVEISYEDFKPVREVRKAIEAIGDCVIVARINRYHSVEAVKEILYRWYEERMTTIQEDGRKVDLFDLVAETLFNETI